MNEGDTLVRPDESFKSPELTSDFLMSVEAAGLVVTEKYPDLQSVVNSIVSAVKKGESTVGFRSFDEYIAVMPELINFPEKSDALRDLATHVTFLASQANIPLKPRERPAPLPPERPEHSNPFFG